MTNEIAPDTIGRVWAVEQEILDVIHQVCTEHGLRYSLAYGTLIGAARHQGFIPWDDDIDLMMPREDYDKLLQIWNDAAPAGYILSNGDTEKDCYINFSKIVKDHTTFLQQDADRERDIHKGIFVDIFPGDRVAPGKLGRICQFAAFAVNMLFSRGYTSQSGGLIEFCERLLLLIPRKFHPSLRSKAQKFASRWNGRVQTNYVFPCTFNDSRKYLAADLFERMEQVEFAGKRYMAVAKWDEYLRDYYGDYMQLPPPEERVWKHHPIIIDFEHNYEELTH